MSELAYLGVALLVSLACSFVFLWRQSRPQSDESGVQQFAQGMRALSNVRPAVTRSAQAGTGRGRASGE